MLLSPRPHAPSADPDADARRLKRAFILALGFVGLLWLIEIARQALDLPLVRFGVHPGDAAGLWGVVLAPLIHGGPAHLLANTPPLLILGSALLYGYPRSAPMVIAGVWLFAGLGVWVFARPSYHIGASGLTFGLMTFLFLVGILRWERRAIALALAVFLLYGGMLWGIFPTRPGISFESHFFGALTGVALAILLRRRDPLPPAKRYSWEDEEEETRP